MINKAIMLKNANAYIDGNLVLKNIIIKNGKIVKITEEDEENVFEIIDCNGKLVLPGTIDTHVHIRDPGHTERETFKTGTSAAAAGGVTTIFEHPISTPPPYNKDIFLNRKEIAKNQAIVDHCFFGALGSETLDNVSEVRNEGAVAFKTFLHKPMKGREEEFKGLTIADDYNILKAMEAVKKADAILAFHAENNDIISGKIEELKCRGKIDISAHFESRPIISESQCVSKLIQFARETGAKIEICHISSVEAMEIVKKAKEEGIDVIAETCPHYIFTCEEECSKYGPMAKCNPPIRKKAEVEKLWEYILDGTVDFIGSDHGPFTYEEKERGYDNIFNAPSGFPGLEGRVPLLLNAVNEKKIRLQKVVELICENPAKIFGLSSKGFIKEGYDADFIIVDMSKNYTLDKKQMYTKSKRIADIFDGVKLKGKIEKTILRGKVIMDNGVVDDELEGYGKFINPLKRGDLL